jgi:hypothetical protein
MRHAALQKGRVSSISLLAEFYAALPLPPGIAVSAVPLWKVFGFGQT